MKRLLLRRRKTGAADPVVVKVKVKAPGAGRRGRRLKRGLRRAGLRLMRKATGRVRSELKQFEREPYLAPF